MKKFALLVIIGNLLLIPFFIIPEFFNFSMLVISSSIVLFIFVELFFPTEL